MSVCSGSGQSSMGAILTIKHNDSQLCVLYDLSTATPLTSLMSLQRESENQWMRTASSEWRCAEQSVTISAGWCGVTSSLTGPCSWHLSTFMRAAKIATMGWALSWELKVQLPLFTSPLLHPLTAPSCHIVRLKVQTSPDSRLETHLEASLWDYGGKQWPSGGAFFIPDLCGQSFTNDHRMVAATAARPQSTLNTQPIALRLKSYYLKVNPCIIHNECIMFLLLPTSPNIRVYINTHLPRTLYNLLW